MNRRIFAWSWLLVLLVAAMVRADGLIIIENPPAAVPGHFRFAPLEVSYHRVDVSIDSGVATTRVDQEFYNPNGQRLEGTYIFPLPDGATIDKFAMDVDGKMMEAELLPADKAKAIYEDIVRRQRDPGLLEYVGRSAFKVRIFPIEPNSRKHVKLQYTQLLKSDSGLSEYVYPLNTEKFSSKPLNDVSVKIDLRTTTPIKNVYCPSHSAEIRRDGSSRAICGWEARGVRPDTDFKLIWSQDKDPVGINLLTWQTGADDGYFLLMASPGMDVDPKLVQPKDICFVIDTSGSMAGPKLEQAKKALQFCLANLNPDDRFEIIRFSTEAEPLFKDVLPASKENLDKARDFVQALKPIGGTAIQDALNQAIKTQPKLREHAKYTQEMAKRDEAPYVIIFLTDGQPTIGETNEDKLVSLIGDTSGNTRIFPFGIGSDINTHLLDRIADKTHAVSQYVLPSEDIEVKVSSFYTKIKEPVLTNLAVAFTNVSISQMYPKDLPDLFKGDTLTVFGRYKGSGPSAAKITGTLQGQSRDFVSDVTFGKDDVKNGFIPRLWATRRVGWLLDEIRLHGESTELKDEIVRLARAHGIVTPYTSYLIVEDEQRRRVPMETRTMRELGEDDKAWNAAKDQYESARGGGKMLEKAGDRAVANAQAANQLKEATSANDSALSGGLAKAPAAPSGEGMGIGGAMFGKPTTQPSNGYRVAQNYTQQARVVNGRAFYQNGKVWTDSTAQQNQQLKQKLVKFNSEEYFALMKDHPEVAAWLALGEDVDLVIDDTLYNVRGEG